MPKNVANDKKIKISIAVFSKTAKIFLIQKIILSKTLKITHYHTFITCTEKPLSGLFQKAKGRRLNSKNTGAPHLKRA